MHNDIPISSGTKTYILEANDKGNCLIAMNLYMIQNDFKYNPEYPLVQKMKE